MRRAPPDSLDPKIHHNNLLTSILAKIEANIAGADDAVMLDHRGFVAETNATHLFLVTGGVLRHPIDRGVPGGHHPAGGAGPGRGSGIGCAVGDYSLAQLHTADELFVTGTMGGLTRCWRWTAGRSAAGEPGGDRAAGRPVCRADRQRRHQII